VSAPASRRRLDRSALFLALLGFGIGAVLLVGAAAIAPPMFDPVGSAALPRACAIVLIALGAAIAARALLSARTAHEGEAEATGTVAGFRPATLATAALMAAYLYAMHAGLGFVLPTVVFAALTVPLVARSLSMIPVGIAIALVLGFGAETVFTRVFFIDLPAMR